MGSNRQENEMIDDIEELLAFGRIGIETGYYEQARGYFERVLALDSSNREAMRRLARANEMLSRRMDMAVEPIQDGPVEPLHKVERKPKFPHHQKSENESEVRGASLLPAPELQGQDSPPLAAHPLFDEAEQEPLEPEAQSAEPLPLQLPSPLPDMATLSDVEVQSDAHSPAGLPTEAKTPTNQTVDLPTTHLFVSSEDSIRVLGLSTHSFDGLMRASIRTIGELLQAIESGILAWFVKGIGPKSVAEIKDSLTRVQLVDAPEPVDESNTPLSDDTSTQADASATQEEKVIFLTEVEAAEYLVASLQTLRTLEREGSLIPFHTPGDRRRYSIRILNEQLERSRASPHHQESGNESEVRSDVTEDRLTILTEREAAEHLGVSRYTLRMMEREGSLIPFRIPGDRRRYSLRALNGYLEKSRSFGAWQGYGVGGLNLMEAQCDKPQQAGDSNTVTPRNPEERKSSSPPIDVLNLSIRSYNFLKRSGLHTVAQVATLSDEELLAIRHLGPKALADIRQKLAVYLAEHPLPDEAREISLETEPRAVGPLPPKPLSSPLNLTPLHVLGLSLRPYSALEHRDITTVEQLARMSDEEIRGVRNIGPKSLAEIQEKLHVYLSANPIPDDASTQAMAPTTQILEVKVPVISQEVIKWQARLVEKQISAGLLHEQARIAGNSMAYWLSSVNNIVDHHQVYEMMASILGASINICEELAFFFDWIQDDHITILLCRYGSRPKTLKEIGSEIGITRERVRQISNKVKRIIGTGVRSVVRTTSVSDLVRNPTLLRIQSALLAAKDMGLGITYEKWVRSIQSSGLVGSWTSKDYMGIDPVEAMIALCNSLADDNIPELRMPDNLRYAIQLAASGTPDLPARIVHLRKTLPKETARLIRRHTRFSGGVNARWLSQEIQEDLAQAKNMLHGLRYRALPKDWFAPFVLSDKHKISKHDVFHHALRKMFQYCGRLPLDDICSGIRYAASKTDFPVPPPEVMQEIMQIYGYTCEDGLYHWDGETDEELSAGEVIIMSCLEQHGPVVHHAELAQAFIDSELTLASLHPTLQRSPLFARIDKGLYKLRGKPVTRQDIGRAKAAGERIPVNPEVEYDKRGNIIISATLSVIAVGTGVIFCEQFPNLSGEWDCLVNGKRLGELYAAVNEFRRLKEPFESLGCQGGDRLKFTFNTWDRSVTMEGVGG